ncbi:hypothetical protein SDJN02_08714, partial [Cucurbita argyrosperma subsp. argyrosperma]
MAPDPLVHPEVCFTVLVELRLKRVIGLCHQLRDQFYWNEILAGLCSLTCICTENRLQSRTSLNVGKTQLMKSIRISVNGASGNFFHRTAFRIDTRASAKLASIILKLVKQWRNREKQENKKKKKKKACWE